MATITALYSMEPNEAGLTQSTEKYKQNKVRPNYKWTQNSKKQNMTKPRERTTNLNSIDGNRMSLLGQPLDCARAHCA